MIYTQIYALTKYSLNNENSNNYSIIEEFKNLIKNFNQSKYLIDPSYFSNNIKKDLKFETLEELNFSIFEYLVNRLGINKDNKELLSNRYTPLMPTINSDCFDILNWNEIEIARQLTLTTHFLYCKIEPFEILSICNNGFDFSCSSNLFIFLNRFNKLNLWIQEEIISYQDVNERALVIGKFIEIAHQLKLLKNYNDLFTILWSLNSYSLNSLKISFEKVEKNKISLFKELCLLCSASDNFYQLKKELKESENKDTCIPFIGVILKDIKEFLLENQIFTNDILNSKSVENLGILIHFFQSFKSKLYPFKPVFKLGFLSDPKVHTEDYLIEFVDKLSKFLF